MTGVTPSNRRIPFDIVITILKFALAAPVSVPPSPADRQLRTSVLSLNHEIRDALIKHLYNTVVLWSVDSLRGFSEALESSPYLGSLVLNLWIGNKSMTVQRLPGLGSQIKENGCEYVPLCLERIMYEMPNLQRLSVAVVGEYGYPVSFRIPQSVRQLALPSMWTIGATFGGTLQNTFDIPPSLESLRIRGSLLFDHPSSIDQFPSNIRRVILEMTDPGEFDAIAITALSMSARRPTSRIAIQVVVSPASSEVRSILSRRRFTDYGEVKLVEQSLDDLSQLGIWLSEGEPPRFGAF